MDPAHWDHPGPTHSDCPFLQKWARGWIVLSPLRSSSLSFLVCGLQPEACRAYSGLCTLHSRIILGSTWGTTESGSALCEASALLNYLSDPLPFIIFPLFLCPLTLKAVAHLETFTNTHPPSLSSSFPSYLSSDLSSS